MRKSKLTYLILTVLCSGVIFIWYAKKSDLKAQIILSNSMRPTLSSGDLIITRSLQREQYKVGDVISFMAYYRGRYLVTHRIVKKDKQVGGAMLYRTKGDANTNGDPWILDGGNIIGKHIVTVPWLGFLLLKLKNPRNIIILGLLSCLLVILPSKIYQSK